MTPTISCLIPSRFSRRAWLRVWPGNLTGLVVTLGDGGDEGTTIGGAQQQGNIGLGGTGDHVLDEVTVTGGIDDGVVVAAGVELLGVAGNGDTTLLLGLLVVHEVGEGERGLTVLGGLLVQLLHHTLINTAHSQQRPVREDFGIDVTGDDNGDVLLPGGHNESFLWFSWCGEKTRGEMGRAPQRQNQAGKQ